MSIKTTLFLTLQATHLRTSASRVTKMKAVKVTQQPPPTVSRGQAVVRLTVEVPDDFFASYANAQVDIKQVDDRIVLVPASVEVE